jgi:hypothetical protein
MLFGSYERVKESLGKKKNRNTLEQFEIYYELSASRPFLEFLSKVLIRLAS